MTVSRVLALLELLQATPGLTGPELAARLEVDERTVRRYAARLSELGLPVEAERGRYGGYRLLPGYRLPPLMLTDDEATAVVLGLLAGRRTGLAVGETATESALAKIQRVLPRSLRERVDAVSEMLGHTTVAARSSAPKAAPLLALAGAARDRITVRLAYRSWRGDDSERDLDPYGIVFHSGRWYVTGLDHASGEVRTFRVDRVASATPTGRGFGEPADFDPVAQVVGSLSAVPYRYEVKVLLDMPLREAAGRIPAVTATLTETAGGVLLAARAERLDGMAQMLAGLGRPFTVITPEELRGEVRALAARLAACAAAVPP
ncbi:putative DNA-binding transcriptional regulator YafY [Streptosporangium becharense]|uniref:Putative DNA-binding transcriptional regulator YafY n=1 Tax=Streptosporangium becharense TaxID=1816182 RepID=A0A7W9MEU2_9ACTN|nr:YafY family protein [Streptosporangium becharense]MBB2915416.1 putative DNA-binding transcriptional regulator YafY [Streptosporangium becharense]MBB5817603.1 putative DNA-binding transcriptional regulator YafY [Streptosporangium becharense]